MNVSEPVQWERASHILFVHEKDSSLRFFIDFEMLSTVTAKHADPILRMDNCLYSFGIVRIFQELDTGLQYRQIEIDDHDNENTTFISPHGL